MTVLSAIVGAAPFIGIDAPSAVFGQTDRELVELQAVANACAQEIAMNEAWQKLSRIHTLTGDGTTEDFDLPSDFHWMVEGGQVWSSSLIQPLEPVRDLNTWLGRLVQDIEMTPGSWIIYGGQMHIREALAAAETVKFFYQSSLIVAPASGSNKVAFTLDTDTFRLDEELLRLCIIWRWRLAKELPYAEHLDAYETRKSQLIARDRGPRSIRVGPPTLPPGVTTAYPKAIIG